MLYFISPGCLGGTWYRRWWSGEQEGRVWDAVFFSGIGPPAILSVAGHASQDMGALLKFQQPTTTLCTGVEKLSQSSQHLERRG